MVKNLFVTLCPQILLSISNCILSGGGDGEVLYSGWLPYQSKAPWIKGQYLIFPPQYSCLAAAPSGRRISDVEFNSGG